MSDTVMTPKFRVSFPDVFRPGKADDSGCAHQQQAQVFLSLR